MEKMVSYKSQHFFLKQNPTKKNKSEEQRAVPTGPPDRIVSSFISSSNSHHFSYNVETGRGGAMDEWAADALTQLNHEHVF